LKTADRYVAGYTSNCVFNLPTIIIPKSKRAIPLAVGEGTRRSTAPRIYLSILNASIPYSFFNVDYFNNLLVYSVGGADITINIPEGNYNVNTLRTYLLSVMTGFTITYNSLNNSFTFTHSTNEFIFKETSTCFEILGLDENVEHTSFGRVLISTNSINLFTIRNIYIQSGNLMNDNIFIL
jgi:hypothetical protein